MATPFDFQRMEVYGKAKILCKTISGVISSYPLDRFAKHRLRKSSMEVLLNIAEGAARPCVSDKVRFLVVARGSAFQCYSLLEHLRDNQQISPTVYNKNTLRLTEISDLLQGLIQHLCKKENSVRPESLKNGIVK